MLKNIILLVFTFPLSLFAQVQNQDTLGLEYFQEMCSQFEKSNTILIEANNSIDAIYNDGNSLRYHNAVNLNFKRNIQLNVSTKGDLGEFQFKINKDDFIVNDIKTGGSESYQVYGDVLKTVETYQAKNEMLFPLGDFLYTNIKGKWISDEVKISYVGDTLIDGEVTKHIAFFTEDTSWELWLNPENNFLPKLMLIRSKDIIGNPNVTISFTKITLD